MIIIRHAEIYTKSQPVRRYFVTRLAHNVETALPDAEVKKKQWRIYVDPENEKEAVEKLKRVFGVASLSVAEMCEADIGKIKRLVEKIKVNGTFAIRVKRISKKFPMNSREIAVAVSEDINHPVNLDEPDIEIMIEIYDKYAYVFTEKIEGPGGLPVGTAGKAVVLLEEKKDVLAGLMMMKRGIKPTIFGKNELREKLKPWAYGVSLKKVDRPFGWAVISGTTDLKKFKELQKKYNQPLFVPLIAFSNAELKILKEKFNV